MRCWVKSRNERNPYLQLPASNVGDSGDTAPVNGEEGGDDVKSSWPLCPGLHTCYNGLYKGLRTREGKPIPKSSPKFGLESATRLHEVGIASNRGSACRGEYVPGPCTHRRHTMRVGCTRSCRANPQGRQAPKVWLMIGVKS